MFIALFSTVAVPVPMACFAMGSLPLLILRHDTPLDSRLIRRLFNTCYLALMARASFSIACCAAVGRLTFSAGMGAIALMAFYSNKRVLARMVLLKGRIVGGDSAAALDFRQLHSVVMPFSAAQLLTVACGLVQMSQPVQT